MKRCKAGHMPPLTMEDILILRGKPSAKNVAPSKTRCENHEEWIYYHSVTNTKEHYVFRNDRLVGWCRE
ncbi:MAG: hypothetical protein HZA48_12385 [Planctomycetes bacterium]|nr:hypothetical protein [Planctomycetota bacterium]